MHIKNKIALTFSGFTLIILLFILGYVYFHALSHSQKEFEKRLLERATITAMYRLEEDELSRDIYDDILDEHLHPIENEREFVMPVDAADTLRATPAFVTRDLLRETRESGQAVQRMADNFSTIGIMYEDNEGVFLVFLSARNSFAANNLKDLRNTLVGMFVVYLLVVFAIGRRYAESALNPLKKIVQQVDKLDYSSLNERIQEPASQDEIWQMARTFNGLLDRIDTAVKIQQNFISNASHELKNPLAAIIGEVDVTLSKERSQEEYVTSLRVIEHEAERLKNLTFRLLQMAETSYTPKNLELAELRLDELMNEVVRDYRLIYPSRELNLKIAESITDPQILKVQVNKALIKMALNNIIDNGLKFSDKQIELEIGQKQGVLQLSIQDFGIGIPKDDIESLFIPFFRSSNARSVPGFGIGLPLMKRILDMHGIEVQVDSDAGKPTLFTLFFPKK